MSIIRQVGSNLYEFALSPTTKATAIETADSLFEKGLEAANAGRIDEALETYQKAHSLASGPASAWAVLNNGTIEYNRGNKIVAEDCYRKALEINPHYPMAHFNLAKCLSDRLERAESIEHYLRALALRPDYGDGHYNLALEYQSIGERRKALTHWRLYLRFSGNEPTWQSAAKRQIDKLKAQDLQVMTKPANSAQAEAAAVDSEVS
jgi:tetratricopeptide (TPR) repeat protein